MPSIADDLLNWYDKNARVLPWRSHPSPYRTWVSEVMLQQTQVETVLPYYERWLSLFPTVESLAAADQKDVLIAWEGLGYYARARNLHRAAQLIMEEFDGVFPQDEKTWLKLPGVGRYTARAILSIAFGQPLPTLDGNIRRVFSRILASPQPVGTPSSDKEFWQFANKVLPANRAGDFNQALMDLGSRICTPQNPDCHACPLRTHCFAYERGEQALYPVKRDKPSVPHWQVGAAVIVKEDKVLIARRPQKGLLAGLWEFPGGKLEETDASLEACVQREIMEELGLKVTVRKKIGTFSHAYTHFKVTVHAFYAALAPAAHLVENEEVLLVRPANLAQYPMGKVDRMISNRIAEQIKR
ncbi:MAG: A/G-specific adenine glycosylase [Anaerolineaceae bacterium]|jgi:A/G-specific adenine glycosylase